VAARGAVGGSLMARVSRRAESRRGAAAGSASAAPRQRPSRQVAPRASGRAWWSRSGTEREGWCGERRPVPHSAGGSRRGAGADPGRAGRPLPARRAGRRPPLGWHRGRTWWADSGWTLAAVLAVAAGLRTAFRVQAHDRVVWLLFAAACGSWLLGQLAYDYDELLAPAFPASPNLSDGGFLGFALPFVLGFVLLGRDRRTSTWLLGLDLAVLALALALLALLAFEADVRHTVLTAPGVVTTLLYPICYGTLSGALLLVPVARIWRDRSLRLLLLGLLLEVIPFLAWTPLLLRGAYVEGSVLDVLWMAGMLLLAASAYAFRTFPRAAEEGQVSGQLALAPGSRDTSVCRRPRHGQSGGCGGADAAVEHGTGRRTSHQAQVDEAPSLWPGGGRVPPPAPAPGGLSAAPVILAQSGDDQEDTIMPTRKSGRG